MFESCIRRGGSDWRDFLRGGEERDLLIGFDGADRLMGYGGDDQLFGDEDRDYLYGGDDDALSGGDGVTIVTGGQGRDRFMFYGDDHTETTIAAFESGDLLCLIGSQDGGGVTLAQSGDDATAAVGDHLFVLLEDVSVALVADNAMFA